MFFVYLFFSIADEIEKVVTKKGEIEFFLYFIFILRSLLSINLSTQGRSLLPIPFLQT